MAIGRSPVLAVTSVALCSLLAVACGDSGDSDDQAQSSATTQATIPFPSTLGTAPPIISSNDPTKAAPRWEQLRVVTGNAPMEVGPVSVASGAIQWRVKWSCEGGSMVINTTPPATRSGPLVSTACPAQGEGFSRTTGDVTLSISASGPWKATVEQQVDTPLDEPPLPEMATGQVIAKGDFYNIEKTGKGTVTLYRLADGRQALRFEPGFEVINDPDLVVWLSPLERPRTSREMADADHVEISALKSTKGSQNYILPDLPFTPRSIGLYCVPVPAVYIAASLSSGGT